jgi:hypothetical protein
MYVSGVDGKLVCSDIDAPVLPKPKKKERPAKV